MKYEVDKFYTWSSFMTVAGMSSMLWLVAGTVSSAFEWEYPGWFPLALAVFFVVIGDFAHVRYGTAQHPWSTLPARAPLWIVNSCLVYTTALGGASTLTAGEDDVPSANVAQPRSMDATVAETPQEVGFGRLARKRLFE